MPRPLRILRDLERGEWELIDARPILRSGPIVVRYTGWFERRATPLQRRELPSHYIPLIINFGSRHTRVTRGGPDPMGYATAVSRPAPTIPTSSSKPTPAPAGIQVDFTILGARQFLGIPLDGLTNRAIALDDVFGPRPAA